MNVATVVSTFDFNEASWWGGQPVARKIGEAVSPETGQVDLIFLGRPGVAGLDVGARCTVEGTARSEGDRLVVWNPLYRFEALGLDGD